MGTRVSRMPRSAELICCWDSSLPRGGQMVKPRTPDRARLFSTSPSFVRVCIQSIVSPIARRAASAARRPFESAGSWRSLPGITGHSFAILTQFVAGPKQSVGKQLQVIGRSGGFHVVAERGGENTPAAVLKSPTDDVFAAVPRALCLEEWVRAGID